MQSPFVWNLDCFHNFTLLILMLIRFAIPFMIAFIFKIQYLMFDTQSIYICVRAPLWNDPIWFNCISLRHCSCVETSRLSGASRTHSEDQAACCRLQRKRIQLRLTSAMGNRLTSCFGLAIWWRGRVVAHKHHEAQRLPGIVSQRSDKFPFGYQSTAVGNTFPVILSHTSRQLRRISWWDC